MSNEQDVDTLRALADAYTFVRSRTITEAVAAITLEDLIVEQILFLDSEQDVQEDTSQVRLIGAHGVGLLQRLEDLERRMLDEEHGAVAKIKNMRQEVEEAENNAAQAREAAER